MDTMKNLLFKTLTGGDATISGSVVDRFISGLRGPALLPENVNYDEARKVWNGMIDRRPAPIVQCQGAADVISCVNFARDQGILASIKGGGIISQETLFVIKV
jgi:hypothetical protein